MNIQEALKGYDPETIVKVGCSDGDGYWFVGKVKDIDFTIMDGELYRQTEKLKKLADKRLNDHMGRWPTPQTYLRRELDKPSPNPTPSDYIMELKFWFDAGVRKNKTLQNRIRNLLNYKRLLDRNVKECEMSDPAADKALRVIIEGTERGNFWTVDEAEKQGLPVYGFRKIDKKYTDEVEE